MLHIVMDGAGDMPSEWRDLYNIDVVATPVHFDGKTYHPGVNLDFEGFYRLVDESGVIPKTSQPSPYEFTQRFRQIAKFGDTILAIIISSKLSGTYESAIAAAKELAGELNIITFDTQAGSAAVGMMCREARLMERAGKSMQDILARLDQVRQNLTIVLTLDNLEYARMSGRVKALQASLVSLLNVKPIAELRDGVIVMADKVRTRSRALQRIVEMVYQRVGDQLVNAAVVHARDTETGKTMMEMVKKRLNCKDLIMTDLSLPVAANLGPGTVGVVAYPVK
jgi:DegV family protein with EDD domain